MSRVLVTGSRGFLGRNVVTDLRDAGHAVVGLDTRPGEGDDVVGDVSDPALLHRILDDNGVEAIVHLAAATLGADDDVTAGMRLNVGGTQCVLDAAATLGVGRVVVSSSTAILGHQVYGDGLLDESVGPRPTGAYGYSKSAVEALVAHARRRRPQVDAVVVRVPALFGPWEHETPGRGLMSPPLQLVRAARAGEQAVLAPGGARDWTHAADVAAGLRAVLDADRPQHGLYHLGCGRVWHLEVLARALAERHPSFTWRLSAGDTTIAYGDDLARRRSPLAVDRARDELGVAPSTPDDACRRYLDWVGSNEAAVAPGGLGPRHTREKHHV